ncbi:hypothetical protein CQ14_07015 [Bradyrhizobium lablabi]|uniref:Uncharacterized protein n=1 Tax=Bradyrhizobium lablabi TaxID=722472 RepID=A0A0R3MN74_9BRAD|nr:hypothetical protein [Bradyrhizobium lablabi]KRR21393.1 hypothetical protein CQ14_07015 [Bradyrhizobium lablabi]
MTTFLKSGAAAVAAMMLAATSAQADKLLDGVNNLAHEHMICAAYTAIVTACLIQKEPNDPAVAQYQTYTGNLLTRGLQTGKVAGVSQKAAEARISIAREEMMEEIEKTCSNISILLHKHANSCKALLANGPERLQALITEAEKDAAAAKQKPSQGKRKPLE